MQITSNVGAAQENAARQAFSQSSLQRASTMYRITAQHACDEFHTFISGGVIVELVVQ